MTEIAAISGFGPGAMIMTTQGKLPVEWLEAGDRVITRDHGAQPILHIRRSRTTLPGGRPLPVPLRLNPTGAAGQVALTEPLCLSPTTHVLLRDPQVTLHFGTDEVTAAIGNLSRRKHMRDERDCPRLTYHHLFTSRHELIWCCGIWVETAGPQTARLTSAEQEIDQRADDCRAPRYRLTAREERLMRDMLLPDETLMRLIAA